MDGELLGLLLWCSAGSTYLALLLLNLSLAPQGGEQVVMVCISKSADQEESCAQLKDEPAGQLA